MIDTLSRHISPKRLLHSLGVAETARTLARQHGENEDKAYLAGLLHDCAKGLPPAQMLVKAERAGLTPDACQRLHPELLHPQLGAIIARKDYGVEDEAVLQAIGRHMSGAPGMTRLDMIVNLADMIEPGRDYPGVETLRELARGDITQAMISGLRETMLHVLSQGYILHPDTVNTYNWLLITYNKEAAT